MEENARLDVGDRLPAVPLLSSLNGAKVELWSAGRDAHAVVLLHGAECPACVAYLRELEAARERFRPWDGRVIAVVAGDTDEGRRLREATQTGWAVLADPAGLLWPLATTDDACATIVADRFGQIYQVHDAGAGHRFLTVAQLEEWFRYLATQCPE